MPPPAPFYLNPEFWTALAAGLAIVLSQVSPIRFWFKRPKLGMEMHSRIIVAQRIGNPNINIHLIFTNPTGSVIRVKSMSASVTRDNKQVATLEARAYYQTLKDKAPILLTPFSLKPTDEWGYLVNFFGVISREDEKKFRAAESALKSDIAEKIRLRNKSSEKSEYLVEAEANLVKPFHEAFDQLFVWNPGEYTMTLSIKALPESAAFERKYRFTLFESDTEMLMKGRGDFKFGDGIYFHTGNHDGVGVPVVEA